MSTAPDGPTGGTRRSGTPLLTVRPRRIAIFAGIAAALIVGLTVFVAVELTSSDTGVFFRTSDAVAMVGLGLVFAGGMMLVARPRLRVYPEGLRVRNVLGEQFVPWALLHRVSFPEGANWARLDLADDETVPVLAIQSMDRMRAVEALRAVRNLQATYGPPAPIPHRGDVREPDPVRPLGRLEQIDQRKAAQQPRQWRRARRSGD